MRVKRSVVRERLPLVLWPLGIAAEFAALFYLFRGDAVVTAVAVVNRSVGGSFIACGLVAWQRRPDSRTGPLMTLTGFVFLSEALLSEVDSHVAYTLGQWSANWWIPPFAALVLGFPTGRLSSRVDRAVVGAFIFGTVVGQLVWMFFLPFPTGKENAFLISADPDLANTIDRFESGFNGTVGLALAILGISRWLRAAPPLRRLLLPTLAGAVTALVLVIQTYYALLTGEFIRASQEVTAVLLVSVPIAFLVGVLHQQLARAGMADLVVALHRAPNPRGLEAALARALGDPSLVVAYWLPRFDAYVDAGGTPVTLPEAGSGRAATFVDNEGRHIAALVHDASLVHQPDLLEVVCAALANVAKYAEATSVTMRVWRSGPVASIEVADDGVGGAHDAGGSGLRGLADRVEALQGSLRVVSPPGAGTVVTAELPCGS